MSKTIEPVHRFDDSDAYERFMGAWSRAATPVFLEWLSAGRGLRWLDVGCGTGILAEAVLASARPATIDAIDPAAAQVRRAAMTIAGARFVIADAQALPFPARSFEVVASALALNLIRDRPRALLEMHRVARCGATVAAFVWDFAADRSPSWPMRRGLRIIGAQVPDVPGTGESQLESLQSLFSRAGLDNVATFRFDVALSYPDFDDFWTAQTPSYSPTTAVIDALTGSERSRLKESVRELFAVDVAEPLVYSARANAIRSVALSGL